LISSHNQFIPIAYQQRVLHTDLATQEMAAVQEGQLGNGLIGIAHFARVERAIHMVLRRQ